MNPAPSDNAPGDECRAENCKAKYHPHKRYCPQEHDTFECGRRHPAGCRECGRQQSNAAYAASAERREQAQRKQREWYWGDPARARALQREQYWRDPELSRQKGRDYYLRRPFEVHQGALLAKRRWKALRRLEQAVGASD